MASQHIRLPRARGDRPCLGYICTLWQKAPPRTRGSPRGPRTVRASDRGSPAHAGIAPRQDRTRMSDQGLPRARGDRPTPRQPAQSSIPAPPRTRGSPPAGRRARPALRGSPAHAGIARRRCSSARCSTRLPRARGDRPSSRCRSVTRCPAPPRTRGSPRAHRRAQGRAGGSPAHAGIAPARGGR